MSIESTCGWRRCCPSDCCGFYCLLEKRLCAGPCRVYAPLQRTRKTFLYKRSHPDLIHESVVMPRPCIWSATTPPSKTPAPFELEFHMATRPHARTKRNDFPVGVTPQPPMLLIYDSVTHYASSNRMICCTYPCVHYSFKLAAIIACCALLGGLAPCSALLGGLTPCIAACSPLDLDGARTIRNRRWCSCLHICSRWSHNGVLASRSVFDQREKGWDNCGIYIYIYRYIYMHIYIYIYI